MYTNYAQSIANLKGKIDDDLYAVLSQLGNCMADLLHRAPVTIEVDPFATAYPNNPNSGAPGIPDYHPFGGDIPLGVPLQPNQAGANPLPFAAINLLNAGADVQVPDGDVMDIFDDLRQVVVANGAAANVVGPMILQPGQIHDPNAAFDPAANAPGGFGNRICLIVNGAGILREIAVQFINGVPVGPGGVPNPDDLPTSTTPDYIQGWENGEPVKVAVGSC